MPVVVGVLKETAANETRVALTPEIAGKLKGLGARVLVERGAGTAAQFTDNAYGDAELTDAPAILSSADILLCVQPPSIETVNALKPGAVVAGFMQAYARQDLVRALKERRITSFAMELVPRISRAQSMDALSSQASVAGYKAALIAANALKKFLPMLTTAAGTIRPASVLVIGAGVAGLQAIATAKRLGAVVEAYDVRSATRDQVKSLGAKFVETGVSAEGTGGYARELTAEEKAKQQEVLDARIAASDVVISTAANPGPRRAAHREPRSRRAHEAGVGAGRHRRRAGRQLRADPRGRDHRSRRRHHHRSRQSAGDAALSRERDVRAQLVQFLEAGDAEGRIRRGLEG